MPYQISHSVGFFAYSLFASCLRNPVLNWSSSGTVANIRHFFQIYNCLWNKQLFFLLVTHTAQSDGFRTHCWGCHPDKQNNIDIIFILLMSYERTFLFPSKIVWFFSPFYQMVNFSSEPSPGSPGKKLQRHRPMAIIVCLLYHQISFRKHIVDLQILPVLRMSLSLVWVCSVSPHPRTSFADYIAKCREAVYQVKNNLSS